MPAASDFQLLSGVSAFSSDDAWAVGYEQVGDSARTLVEHWDGTAWSRVASPNPDAGPQSYDVLNAVDLRSPVDGWAVGTYVGKTGAFVPLVVHWDGTRWTVVPSARPGIGVAELAAVSASSADDAWAVGQFRTKTDSDPALLEHWDGNQWTRVPGPRFPGWRSTHLESVDDLSSANVWAAGQRTLAGERLRSVLLHWNGHGWRFGAPARQPHGYPQGGLTGLGSTGGSDIWTVGSYARTDRYNHTLMERFDGTSWTRKPGVDLPGPGDNLLTGVSVVSASDVWTTGYHNPQHAQTMIEHWDGSRWSLVPSPSPPQAALLAISMVGADDGWAVGGFGGSAVHMLIEHWDGHAWARVMSAVGPGAQRGATRG